MWTLIEGQEYLRTIYNRIQSANFHLGIIGSVINFGISQNDLDIVILPYDNDESKLPLYYNLENYLFELGANKIDREEYTHGNHVREIYKLHIDNKVIDFFVY